MIDAHHHLWRIGRNGQVWPGPDLPDIYRDFLPADFQAAADALDGGVLVQSQPCEADALWLLRLAEATPSILGVVGWTDLAAPDAPERIAELAKHPKLRGLRPMLQGLDDEAWILRPECEPGLAAMIAHKLSFDALVFPRHLPHIAELARRWPELAIVIDHGAKPPIATPAQAPAWREAISAAAARPNIACKLSGLITEAAPGADFDAVRPYADHLLAVFGPERLIWGSDWPVLNLRADWRGWRDWTRAWLRERTAAEIRAIMGDNAVRFYMLDKVAA